MTGTGYSRYQQQEDIEYMTAAAGATDISITVIITIIIIIIIISRGWLQLRLGHGPAQRRGGDR